MRAALSQQRSYTREAVSFRQFANSVFRRYGGLSYRYADKTVRTLLMSAAIRECSPLLKIYGSLASDPASAAPILAAISELKRSRITPDALAIAAMNFVGEEAMIMITVSLPINMLI